MASSSSSPSAGKKAGALASFVAISVVAGVVAAGLAIPAVGAATSGAQASVGVFEALPSSLEERPLAQQSTMLAADGSTLTKFYWQNRVEVPIAKTAKYVQEATVAVEDARFFDHGGVDVQGIGRALVNNLVTSNTQGASTLTQQYVKNVLQENAASEGDTEGVDAATEAQGTEGVARKLREAKLAIALEKKYSKTEILERYLNINNYGGSPRQYGVEAAAQHYWGIHAKDLNLQQSALLAGIVQNPSAFNPEKHPKESTERRNVVLDRMLAQKYITQAQHDKAVKAKLDFKIHNIPNGCEAAGISAYFCDYVQHTVENDPIFGKNADDRKNVLQRGGLRVKTTIDPKLQKLASAQVMKKVPAKDPSGAGHSIVTVEPGTGRVLAMAENRDYYTGDAKKVPKGKTGINYNVDRSLGGGIGFQPGSTWKAFVLTQWLQSGRQLYDTVDASKGSKSQPYVGFNSSCDSKYTGQRYSLSNAGDSEGKGGPMSVLEGTKDSVNTAFAAMASKLDMCKIRDTAASMGVHEGDGKALKDARTYDGYKTALLPSTILGSMNIAPVTMAAAYATFASGGTFCKPIGIDSITDRNGKDVKVPDADCKRVLDKDIAQGVSYALSQTFNGGTTSGLQIGVPAGAKTGTTNFEVGSSWLVGFTKTLSTAVWTGDPKGSRDWRYNSKGVVRGQVFGATISGVSWSAYMRKAVRDTTGNTGFPRPPSSIMGSPPPPPKAPATKTPGGTTKPGTGTVTPNKATGGQKQIGGNGGDRGKGDGKKKD